MLLPIRRGEPVMIEAVFIELTPLAGLAFAPAVVRVDTPFGPSSFQQILVRADRLRRRGDR